jgi:hypothetical protein
MAIAMVLARCADLQQVNNFAATSESALKEYESLPVGFKTVCLNRCKEISIKNLELDTSACDCRLEVMADSIDNLFYNKIGGYLDGLEKLSAGKLTTYNVDTLTDKLTSSNFGSVKLSSDQASAYGKIGSILAKAVTDGYRRKKIKEYIQEADKPLSVMAGFLKFNLVNNIGIKFRSLQLRIESDYFDILKDKNVDSYEKRFVMEDYYQLRATMERQQEQLRDYGKVLDKIVEGHHKLCENADKLSLDAVKSMASQYASNIKDMQTQIKKLAQ